MKNRPLSVLLVALLYIAVGTIGFAFHFPNLNSQGAFHSEDVLVEVTELCAVLCGAFMLRGQNWARWLAVAWIAFHVVLSVFEAYRGFLVHCILCALIAWAVFRPEASRYFRDSTASTE